MTSHSQIPRLGRLLACLLSLPLLFTLPLAAQNFTWNGGGFAGDWSIPENWSGGVGLSASTTNGTLTFSGTSRLVNNNDLADMAFTSLTLNGANFDLSGLGIKLSTGGITVGTAGNSHRVANDLTYYGTGNRTIQLQNAGTANGLLTLSGSFTAPGIEIRKDGGGNHLMFDGAGKSLTTGLFTLRKGGVYLTNGVAANFTGWTVGGDATWATIYEPFANVDGATVNVSGTITVGANANDGRFNIASGGTVSAVTLILGQNIGSKPGSGVYLSDGLLNVGSLRLGNNGPCTLNVSGGTLTVTNGGTSTKLVEASGNSVFNLSGSGVVKIGPAGAAIFNLATTATPVGQGTLNLNGGTFETGGFEKQDVESLAVVNWNGGTLKAGAGTASFLPGLPNTTVNVGTGGASIDTAGFDIGITAALVNNGAGGLTKSGAGSLTLGGANTYAGDTVVTTGTLALTNGAAIPNASVLRLAAGTQARVDSDETVAALYLANVLQVAGTWGSSLSAAANVNDTYFTGTNVLTALGGATPNSAPTNILLSVSSITENNTNGAPIGTFSTEDPNVGNTFTYTLVSGTGDANNASFTIAGDQLLAAEVFSVTASTNYTIRVRSTDQGSLAVEKVFLITIIAANPPTDIALSSASIGINYVAPAVVGTLSATDADAGEIFTFTLEPGAGDTDNGSFSISGNQLSVITPLAGGNYSIRVRVTDSTTEFYEEAFVITVNPNFAWSGTGSDNLWSTGLNWLGAVAPAGGLGDLIFTNHLRATNVNNLVGLTTSGIKFSDLSLTNLDGSPVELGDWALSGNPLTVAVPVNNGQGVYGSPGGTVVISNDITQAGSPSVFRTAIFTTHFASNSVVVLSGNYNAGSGTGGYEVWKDGGGTTNSPSTLVFNGTGKTVTGKSLTVRKGVLTFENGVVANFSGGDSTLGQDVPWQLNSPLTEVKGVGTTVTFGNTLKVANAVNDAKLLVSSGGSVIVTNNLQTGSGASYRDQIELQTGGVITARSSVILGQNVSADATNGWYQTGGAAYVTSSFRAGNNGPCTVEISGGLLVVTNADGMRLVEKGNTTMTIGGSGVVQCGAAGDNRFLLVQDVGTLGQGTLNLNSGGTIRLAAFTRNNTTLPVTVNFNGGTLEANNTAPTNLIPDLANTTWNVGNSGLTVSVAATRTASIDASLTAAGAGGLTKTDAGTLLLNGANTYSGLTTVSGGGLGGVGSIAGNVTTAAGAIIAPGSNGIGTLSIGGNLTSAGGFAIKLDTALVQSNDVIAVTGSQTQSGAGTMTVTNLGPALVVGQKFYPFNGEILTGGAALNVVSLTPGVSFINNLAVDGSIEVAPFAPSPTNLTYSVIAGGQLVLDWPAGLGWRLERQTNSLAIGLSTNWQQVATVPPYTNANNVAPTVFFRLVYP